MSHTESDSCHLGHRAVTSDALLERYQIARAVEMMAGGWTFLGIPDRWMEHPHWRCPNGHVSTCTLRCEEEPYTRCLACRAWVILTFPEDREETGYDRHSHRPPMDLT